MTAAAPGTARVYETVFIAPPTLAEADVDKLIDEVKETFASRGAAVTWPNAKGFVGGVQDDTGLTHLGAREYDPSIGRFVSVDPVFNVDVPEQMNGYAYAANSPVTDSDPTGLVNVEPEHPAPTFATPLQIHQRKPVPPEHRRDDSLDPGQPLPRLHATTPGARKKWAAPTFAAV